MIITNLHPVIRLAMFLVFALLLTRATVLQLVVGILLVSGVLPWLPRDCTRQALQRLWRIRWLFFSILMVFALMTPGQGIAGFTGMLWPSYEGLAGGVRQCALLALIVLAVNILLYVTSREELLLGLRWWLAPLSFVGMHRDRIALRLMLVLAVVPRVQDMVREQLATQSLRKLSFTSAGSIAAALFSQAEACAAENQDATLKVAPLTHPGVWQWLWPLLLTVLLLGARWFNSVP